MDVKILKYGSQVKPFTIRFDAEAAAEKISILSHRLIATFDEGEKQLAISGLGHKIFINSGTLLANA